MIINKDIRKLSKEELTAAFADMGEPKFRAGQVYEWLWQKSARSFDEMTNLSKPLREKLKEQFTFYGLSDTVIVSVSLGVLAFELTVTVLVNPPRRLMS